DSTVAREGLRQAEQMAEQTKRLSAVVAGKDQLKAASERLASAWLCQVHRQEYAAAVRFYEKAFAAELKLADTPDLPYRSNAARAGALAGCGQGKDANKLDDKERAHMRKLAQDWLRADLTGWVGLLDAGPPPSAANISNVLQHWLVDTDFGDVRGPESLASLPEAERQSWQQLWTDVVEVLKRAQGMVGTPKNRPD